MSENPAVLATAASYNTNNSSWSHGVHPLRHQGATATIYAEIHLLITLDRHTYALFRYIKGQLQSKFYPMFFIA